MPLPLKIAICFSNIQGQVRWQGKRLIDLQEFDEYLRGPVLERLMDKEYEHDFASDMRALATTDMAIDTLQQLLAFEPKRKPWEVGEALAESLLKDELGIVLPWNMERDKRTPRASLPGADLIGFLKEDEEVFLVLGEVKTSWDKSAPPNVMSGRSGMIYQLDRLAVDREIHSTLLKWLNVRCKQEPFQSLYRQAVQKYLNSQGRDIMLCGLLLRDTNPNELDLKNRALKLAKNVVAPTRIELTAWYLPRSIKKWVEITEGGTR